MSEKVNVDTYLVVLDKMLEYLRDAKNKPEIEQVFALNWTFEQHKIPDFVVSQLWTKLEADGHIEFKNETPPRNPNITFRGIYFLEEGGYTEAKIKSDKEQKLRDGELTTRRVSNTAAITSTGVAVLTLIALLYQIFKTQEIEIVKPIPQEAPLKIQLQQVELDTGLGSLMHQTLKSELQIQPKKLDSTSQELIRVQQK